MQVFRFLVSPPAHLPLRGAASGPRSAAGAPALRGALRLHQEPRAAAVRGHGVGDGRGGGQHHSGAAGHGPLEQHGAGVLHGYVIFFCFAF